jgi:hypothetical protein
MKMWPKKVGGDDKPESPFKKRMREKVENEIKEKRLAEIEKKIEDGIITTYLDKLEKQIRDKKLSSFYVLADNAGFKKFNGSSGTIQKMFDENPEKYIGKKIASFTIFYHQHDKENDFDSLKDVWLSVTLQIFCPNNQTGKISNYDSKAHGVKFYWRTEDFRKTRFTFKFLEMIMHAFIDKYSDLRSLKGMTIERLFYHLDKRKIAYKHLLNPLAGL